MPIYEYLCQACPNCSGRELEQQFSTLAVGSSGARTAPSGPTGACGSCGDPRGPGSCSFN